ncbi:MarR family winged helix-turn-helix transcriptional regulator [Brevibacillus nitrificans]|uniref:MarR family winged helix-turn-helix transcriptional regulator n=1 Tax=Brevibacillus nitrificans TaxID=651560 RepID=UPI002601B5C0|nr:MarR family winged helix-turn-helix transcriptional regulator [Brevibacillus nitrificans]
MKEDLQQYVQDLPMPSTVFFALVETTAKLVDHSEKYWQSQGLTGARIRILVEIMKEGGSILPSMLAERIGVSKANISLLLGPLESEQWIRREPHAVDGRKTVITITAAGQNVLLKHLPGNRQRIEDSMRALDETEQRQLLSLLNKLRRG